MDGLSRDLVKSFAEVVNEPKQKEPVRYVRGTITGKGDAKYVQLDGSTVATPISEVVDAQEGDRVLVSIENHRAVIVGNFTFSPSARQEQEALEKAEGAENTANSAGETANAAQLAAQEASKNANEAMNAASAASASAAEAKDQAADAMVAAGNVEGLAQEAKENATQANENATQAKNDAAAAQAAVANANEEIGKINDAIETAQGDIDEALDNLHSQADEIEVIKRDYSTKVETENVKAELSTQITESVGELQTTITQNYYTKNEVVEIQGNLQSQITQNAEGLSSQATKIESLESDTATAQEQVDQALEKANAAQQAATQAQQDAATANEAAEKAQNEADIATEKAQNANDAALDAKLAAHVADEALADAREALDQARENYKNVVSNPGSTAEDIANAAAQVETARQAVETALEDAAEAQYVANKAQEAADVAQEEANAASQAAQTAQNKADAAEQAANNAQAAAEQAAEDVAALTKRVTTAETKIDQNAEQISLNATKTEEIGDKLVNDYYSKTETDALIKVESDRITSTVSKVETVEKTAITSTIEEFYLSSSPTSLSGGSWVTTQPTWTQGKYIWRRMKVTKGDGTTSYSPSQNGVCITGNTGATGPQGEPGEDGKDGTSGKDGVGIKSTTITYQASTSGTTPPTGTWSSSVPTVADGSYLWTRTVLTYTNSTSSTFYTVSRMGKVGADGAPGAPGKDGQDGSDGKSVSSMTTEFYLSTSKTTQTGGSWTTTMPTWITGKYLWTRYKIVYTNPSSTAYTTPVCDSSWEAVNEIEIGGRNLLLQTGIPKSSIDALVGSYPVGTMIPVVGKTYTLSLYGSLGTDKTGWLLYISGRESEGAVCNLTSDDFNNGVWTKTFNWTHLIDPITVEDSTDTETGTDEDEEVEKTYVAVIDVYVNPQTAGTSSSTISKIKLEEGNKVTTHTIAPEDVEQDYTDDINSASESTNIRITQAESSIEQLSNMIANLVTDENGGSLMTQTPDGWTFNMSTITSNLDTIKNEMANMSSEHSETNSALENLTQLVNDVTNKTAYITMSTDENGDPCIELGKSDSDFKVRITNTAIDFLEGSTRIAYVNNNTFYATKIMARDGVQIGAGPGFEWRVRENGNMGLIYIS